MFLIYSPFIPQVDNPDVKKKSPAYDNPGYAHSDPSSAGPGPGELFIQKHWKIHIYFIISPQRVFSINIIYMLQLYSPG